MDYSIITIVAIAFGLLTGFFAHKIMFSKQKNYENTIKIAEETNLLKEQFNNEVVTLKTENAALEAKVTAYYNQIEEYKSRETKAEKNKIANLENENKIITTLAPMQEILSQVNKNISQLEKDRSIQYTQISEQLLNAQKATEQVKATTESLAGALKNNNIRGSWGEAQLKNIVESAGLLQYVDFETQAVINSSDGNARPDMLVKLPGNKHIAIDAKVPFTSYLEASNISNTAMGEEKTRRENLLKQHAKALRKHVDALSSKSYWSKIDNTPEFTIAFIPNEALLSAALEADPALLEYAFSKRIALASPVNLWAVLKTVSYAWQQETLSEDAKKLFDLSKELYKRISTLASHAEKLRNSINSTVKNYNAFSSTLETRVLVTARKLENIDENKLIPTAENIEEQTLAFKRGELLEEE